MSNYCTNCGTQSNGGNFCSKCGMPIVKDIETPKNVNSVSNNYQMYGYQQSEQKKNKKGGFTAKNVAKGCGISALVVFAFFAIVVVLALVLPESESTDGSSSKNTANETIVLLMEEGKITEDEAEIIEKDLKSVGIEDLTSLEEFEGAQVDGMKSFEYSSSKVSGTLIIQDGKTDYIDSGDIVLFDDEKGGAIDDISRYYLSKDEKDLYLYSAQELVKQNLKSPSTAEFPNWYGGEWRVTRKDDVVTVVSYVDAQNAFGAMIREKFAVQYSYSTQTCTYFEFGGEVVYGKAQTGE